MKDMKFSRDWSWHVGGCATCGARGVPVATNDYYTNCAGCLRKAAEELAANAGSTSGEEAVGELQT